MSRRVQLVLIACLLAFGWSQRDSHLSQGCYWVTGALPSGLLEAASELASISSYPRQTVDSDTLIASWCEPLRQQP